MLDRRNLEEEFDMAPIEAEVVEEDTPDPFEQEWEEENDPRTSIKENIERANSILDLVEEELRNGNFTPRLVEVAAGLINSVTAAGKELLTDEYNKKYLQIRQRLVELKKEEVEIKKLKVEKPRNQYNIIATREDVLKILNEDKRPKQIEESSVDSNSEENE